MSSSLWTHSQSEPAVFFSWLILKFFGITNSYEQSLPLFFAMDWNHLLNLIAEPVNIFSCSLLTTNNFPKKVLENFSFWALPVKCFLEYWRFLLSPWINVIFENRQLHSLTHLRSKTLFLLFLYGVKKPTITKDKTI